MKKFNQLIGRIIIVSLIALFSLNLEAETAVNVSQVNIIKNLHEYARYAEVECATISHHFSSCLSEKQYRDYQAYYNTDVVGVFTGYINDGSCSGLTILWLYSKWSKMQLDLSCPLENWYWSIEDYSQQKPNYDKFKTDMELIASWDWNGKKKLSATERDVFEQHIQNIEYFQNFPSQMGVDKMLPCPVNKRLKKEYSISSLFTLEQLQELLRLKNIIHDGHMIYIASNNHATGLFKDDKNYFHYDPNCPTGEVKSDSTDEIAKLVFSANRFDESQPSPISIVIFHFDPDTTSAVTTPYPPVKEVLGKIKPDLKAVSGYADEITCLHMAVAANDISSLQYFLDCGIDPNIKDAKGRAALALAMVYENPEIITLLLKHPDINYEDTDADGSSVLMHSIKSPNIFNLVWKYPKVYNYPNIRDKNGNTALMHAVLFNNVEIVKNLLDNPNIDPNIANNCSRHPFPRPHSETPLMAALSKGYIEIAKLLLEAPNVNPEALNNKGKSALIKAIEAHDINGIDMLLNSSRVDINKQNINGETALIYAIKNLKRSCCFNPDKEEKLIQSLLTKGADVNLQDENGNTALMEAVLLRRKMYCGDAAKESTDIDIKIIRDILSSGKVKLDLKNNLGMTAFDIATRRDPILINHEERRSIPGVIAIFQECVKNLLDQHLISINDPEVKKILPSASKGWLWW